MRHCPCGKGIPDKQQLCRECNEIYGDKREDYPQWLVESLRMEDQWIESERKRMDKEIQFTDMGDDLEDYIWSNV